MKMRADHMITAVGELRTGLLAVRRFTDTLLSTIDATSLRTTSADPKSRPIERSAAICLDRNRSDKALIAFALVTIVTLALRRS